MEQEIILPMTRRRLDVGNVVAIGAVHIMALAAIARLLFFSHSTVEWILFTALFTALYAISMLGVTLCYHRWLVLTHKAFRVPSSWFRKVLLTAAAISAQGSVRTWVPDHIVHHMYEDQAGRDPHSPDEFLPIGADRERDETVIAALSCACRLWLMAKGFFWAHVGWRIWKQNPFVHAEVERQRKRLFDTTKSGGHGTEVVADLRWQCRWIWPLIIVPGFVAPAFIAGVIIGALNTPLAGALAALDAALIAGFLRLAVALHATWSVNSAAHMIGTPARHDCGCVWEKSHARNCAPLMLITMGEWGHGNHHYDGSWAFFSERCDPGKWALLLCERLGFVCEVNRERKSRRCPVHG